MTATMTSSRAADPARVGPSAQPSPTRKLLPPPWPVLDRIARRSDSFELGPYPSAVPSARLRTSAILAEWGLAELADDAESVVAELVANSVQAHQREHLDAPVRLTLLAGLRTVLIVVRDASGCAPAPGSPDERDEHGRGLLIVQAFTAYWDARPCPGGGKVIRALLRGQRSA